MKVKDIDKRKAPFIQFGHEYGIMPLNVQEHREGLSITELYFYKDSLLPRRDGVQECDATMLH